MLIRLFWIFFFSYLMINSLYAQICGGSLGDPIVNITFGGGTNPGGPLSAATTNYQYVTNDCPSDGYYTVRNTTAGCFGNSWHTVTGDHTGNTNGYFMLVNASVQPGAFYLDTVRGLCERTNYEFAAWIMNVLLPSACGGNGNQPNITMSIENTDGTLLQSYNSGNIVPLAAPSWQQYGSYFTTPPGVTEIVLRIVNNAPGGCGNDLALDDITFRPCGPVITGTIDGVPVYDAAFCEGPLRQFVLNCMVSGGFTNPVFRWQNRNPISPNWSDIAMADLNTLNVTFVPNTPPGNYQFRLAVAESGNITSATCRVYSQTFTITVNARPVTTTNNNGPACTGSSLVLSATGGSVYAWDGPNGFTATGTPVTINDIQVNQAGKYYVTVSSATGCTQRDSTTIVVNPVPLAVTGFAIDSLCSADSLQLTASGGSNYQWIPSTGLSNANISNPRASPSQTTTYSVIVSNTFSCKDTAMSTIGVIPAPVADAGPDKIIFEGESTQLSGSIGGSGNSFSWSPPFYINDINALQPVVQPPADQMYKLTVISGFGCGIVSDSVLVKVYKDIFIPTAFTPNNDGLNDTWNIAGLAALKSFRVTVYDRWGQIVFQTKDKPVSWNGMYKGGELPAGVYAYLVEKGTNKTLVKGIVMLIR